MGEETVDNFARYTYGTDHVALLYTVPAEGLPAEIIERIAKISNDYRRINRRVGRGYAAVTLRWEHGGREGKIWGIEAGTISDYAPRIQPGDFLRLQIRGRDKLQLWTLKQLEDALKPAESGVQEPALADK